MLYAKVRVVVLKRRQVVGEIKESERQLLVHRINTGLHSSHKDGWGSLSGFILRRKVPRHIKIASVDPNFKGDERLGMNEFIQDALAAGDIVTHNDDGAFTIEPNPNLSPKERFARAKERQLSQQAAWEEAARFPKGQ